MLKVNYSLEKVTDIRDIKYLLDEESRRRFNNRRKKSATKVWR
jgi:hypothetical protein